MAKKQLLIHLLLHLNLINPKLSHCRKESDSSFLNYNKVPPEGLRLIERPLKWNPLVATDRKELNPNNKQLQGCSCQTQPCNLMFKPWWCHMFESGKQKVFTPRNESKTQTFPTANVLLTRFSSALDQISWSSSEQIHLLTTEDHVVCVKKLQKS